MKKSGDSAVDGADGFLPDIVDNDHCDGDSGFNDRPEAMLSVKNRSILCDFDGFPVLFPGSGGHVIGIAGNVQLADIPVHGVAFQHLGRHIRSDVKRFCDDFLHDFNLSCLLFFEFKVCQ